MSLSLQMGSIGQLARAGIAASGLVSAALLGGCSTTSAPGLKVEGVTLGERTQDGVVAIFTVRGENSGIDPLPLKRATYSLMLGGKTVFTGERMPLATLPGSGAQRFTIPASIPASALPEGTGRGLFEYTLSGRIVYSEPGPISEILFDSGISQPEASFSGTGVLDLSR